MATLIPASGVPRFVEPAAGPSFSLAEIQGIVGGYIEALRTPFMIEGDDRPLVMFLNEDGKRLQLPINRFATHLMREVLQPEDYIVGDVVICSPTEAGEDDDGEDDPT